MLDLVGWIATAFFAASYFLKSPSALRRCQAVAAVLWVFYGILIRAAPVVVANVIVAAMALGSTYRVGKRRDTGFSRSRQPNGNL